MVLTSIPIAILKTVIRYRNLINVHVMETDYKTLATSRSDLREEMRRNYLINIGS